MTQNLAPKPKGETEAQRVKRFAATGSPRHVAIAKLWRAGVFPKDAETDFYMNNATVRCWRLKRDISPLTKNGKVYRFCCTDIAGATYILADKDAPAKIRKFFTPQAARLSMRKYKAQQRAEKARIKAFNSRTPEQIAADNAKLTAYLAELTAKRRTKAIRTARQAMPVDKYPAYYTVRTYGTPPQRAAKKSPATLAGVSEYAKTLKETNTPERTAQYWQKIADVPQSQFDGYIASVQESDRNEITVAGLFKSTVSNTRILKVWVRTLVKMYADDPSLDYIPPIIRAELCRQAKKDGDCVEILAVALPREVKS